MALSALAVLLLTMASTSENAQASATSGACEREIQSAARKYGVPEGILYSVGLTETGRKGSWTPTP